MASTAARVTARATCNAGDVVEIDTPVLAQAEVTTAELAVHVVVERALLAVLEENADEARAAGDDRGHHLDDGAETPLFLGDVEDAVTEPEEESLVAVEHLRSSTCAHVTGTLA